MKQILQFLCVMALVFVTGHANAQTKVPDHFRAQIETMTPLRYQTRTVTDFYLEIRGDTMELSLPYMGEVYTPTFSHDGLNFTAKATKLVRGKDKKGADTLALEVRHDIVNYAFRMTLYEGGNIYINLSPSNAQSCSYSGSWEAIEK